MSIKTVRERIGLLQQQIQGVATAYVQLPRGIIPTANLPTFINFVRDGQNDQGSLGQNDIYTTRTYLMWFLLKPVAEGEEGEGEALVEPWIEPISKFFMARPSLANLQFVQSAVLLGDSGPKKMIWPGTPAKPLGLYWGAEFQLNVTEVSHIEYSDYE